MTVREFLAKRLRRKNMGHKHTEKQAVLNSATIARKMGGA